MALYCYIVETGEYSSRESHILGHENKYSPDEFDDLCIEITKKYGDVKEKEDFDISDLTDVKKNIYTINPYSLIEYLISEYGFVELEVPVNDGYNVKEISRKPVPRENLVKVELKPKKQCPSTPPVENEITCIHPDSDFDGLTNIEHFNARCSVIRKNKKEE